MIFKRKSKDQKLLNKLRYRERVFDVELNSYIIELYGFIDREWVLRELVKAGIVSKEGDYNFGDMYRVNRYWK